jgi:hypothetical protein
MTLQTPTLELVHEPAVPQIDLHPDSTTASAIACDSLTDRAAIALLRACDDVAVVIDPAVATDRMLHADLAELLDLLRAFGSGRRRERYRLYLDDSPEREHALMHAHLRLLDHGLVLRFGLVEAIRPTGPVRLAVALCTEHEASRCWLRLDPAAELAPISPRGIRPRRERHR